MDGSPVVAVVWISASSLSGRRYLNLDGFGLAGAGQSKKRMAWVASCSGVRSSSIKSSGGGMVSDMA